MSGASPMRATPVILVAQRLAIPLKGEDMAAITAAESTRPFVPDQDELPNLADKLGEIEEISHIDYAGSGTLDCNNEPEPWNWVAFNHSPKPGATIPEFEALVMRIGDIIVAYVEACKLEADPAIIAEHGKGRALTFPVVLDFRPGQKDDPDAKAH